MRAFHLPVPLWSASFSFTLLTTVVVPLSAAVAQEPAAQAIVAHETQPGLPAPQLFAPDWTAMGLEDAPDATAEAPASEPYFLNGKPALPAGSAAQGVTTRVNRTVHSDGSAAVTAAGAVREWRGAEFGVDMSLAARPNGPVPSASSGPQDGAGAAAWARAPLPGVAGWQQSTVDVRVDPLQEQSRVGTTFSREVAVTQDVSARLNDSYAVTSTINGTQQWETGKSVSVDMKSTGTSVSVGTATRSGEQAWLPSVSATQQVLGPLSVTTSVADTGENLNKSISAGFRRTW
ncbi:MAG: hypothetical protein AB1592_17400 [Pseudomonadota bacterium]